MRKLDLLKKSKEFIAKNKFKEAIDLLIDYAEKDEVFKEHLDDIIIIASRNNQIEKQSLLGVLTNNDEKKERESLIKALFFILKKFDEIPDFEEVSSQNILGEVSKIKILFLSSNPLGEHPLRLDKEMREIEEELIRSKFRDKFDFLKFTAVRISDLQNALLNYSPNFVHFSGHGNKYGIALLDDSTDETKIVQSEPLARLFKLFSNNIVCVFLNSCYSNNQAKLIKKFIPNVLGMKDEVPDDTAIEFAKAFYKSIGSGRDLSFSFEFAKNSVDLKSIHGSHIPILL